MDKVLTMARVLDTMPEAVDEVTVRREIETLIVGRPNGTYDCDSINCKGETRYTIDVDERATVYLYVTAPRHRPDDYSIKRVRCEPCVDEAELAVKSAASNEAIVKAVLTRDASDEPPYVIDVQVQETSPVGDGVI